MGLERKDISLENILNTALQDPEIAKAIEASYLGKDFFRREIQARFEKIWFSVSNELEDLVQLEGNLARAKKEFDDAAPVKSSLHRFLDAEAVDGLYGLVTVIAPAAIWLLGGLIIGFSKISSKLLAFPWPWVWGLTVILWIGTAILRTVLLRRYKRSYDRYAKDAVLKTRTRELEEAVAKAKSAVENLLLERGIKSELRAIINAESQPNYSLKLSVRTAPGLTEVFDPAYEIPTESRDKVVRMLEDMPGGSIGIAGPRGAGKSTLIWSLCRGAISDLKERPLFAMMTSAPVKYDGREFILHLFSSLCLLILGGPGAEDFSPLDRDSQDPPNLMWRRISRRLILAGPWLATLGTVLILGGLLLAFELAKVPEATHGQNLSTLVTPSPTPAAQANPSPRPSWSEILKASDVKPAPLLYLGLTCLAFAIIPTMARVLDMNRKTPKEADVILAASDRAIERVGRDVAKKASQLIREIRFQQSYSSGWSGALKVPIGIEGSVNTAISLAERQRSLPEVVDAYRDFVKSLTAKNAVLIGIDELDKLESDETAQQFLNEIKSIFGLDHCYYLISVSENAISSFERRGLPFRDAFDSAFDSIIYVDYLTLDSAKRLLKRRVIGLEVPFMCLCYCLSGGLARDLIRSCRDMIEGVRLPTAPTDLGSICAQMVINDIRSKLRAIEVSLTRHRVEPELSLAIDRIRNIEDATVSRETFLIARRNLRPPRFFAEEMNGDAAEAQRRRRAIRDLELELHTYLYFASTLLEFFTNNLSEQQLIAAEDTEEITKLARAKQSFAVNAYTALSILDEFRKRNGLAII